MLLLLGASTIKAQATYTDKDGTEYEFKGYWYLNFLVGAQYSHDSDGSFGKLVTVNDQIGVGYQFTPVFGLRFQSNSWRSKGAWDDYGETGYNRSYHYTYIAPGFDFMFNLSNAFCGWNPKRLFNVEFFIGAGANIAWDNTEAKSLYYLGTEASETIDELWGGTTWRGFGRAGLDFNFRVCDALTIMLEGNANITTNTYNSKHHNGNPDWYFDLIAGIRVNLGKGYKIKEKVEPQPTPQPVERPREQQPRPTPPPPAPKPAPKPEPQPVKKAEPIRRDVFFTIRVAQITESEETKVKEVADYLMANPEAKATVTGYADVGTGNNEINDKVAARRAAAVEKCLTEKYGIDASRITTESKGSRVQPFTENEKNRVAIIIAE